MKTASGVTDRVDRDTIRLLNKRTRRLENAIISRRNWLAVASRGADPKGRDAR